MSHSITTSIMQNNVEGGCICGCQHKSRSDKIKAWMDIAMLELLRAITKRKEEVMFSSGLRLNQSETDDDD